MASTKLEAIYGRDGHAAHKKVGLVCLQPIKNQYVINLLGKALLYIDIYIIKQHKYDRVKRKFKRK